MTTVYNGPKPVFDLRLSLTVNDLMAEQLVDVFKEALRKGIQLPSETFALFRQLESWIGEEEKD